MTFKEIILEALTEATSQDDIIEKLYDLVGTDKKIDEYMWDFFEKNIKGIYAGDATPEDYIEELSKKSNAKLASKLYDELKAKFKGKLNEAKKVNELNVEDAIEIIVNLFGKDKKLDEFFLSFFKKNFSNAFLSGRFNKWEEYKWELERESNAHLVEKLYMELYDKFRKFLK